MVLLHGSKNIEEVKLFVCDLTSFHPFFSKSSKRMVLLTERGFKLPQAVTTRWNFNSRAVSTIIKFFAPLYSVFNEIVDDPDEQWGSISISSARGLKRILDDPIFLFLLFMYEACFIRGDHIFLILQSGSISITCQNEINLAIKVIEDLRTESFVKECFNKSLKLNPEINFSNNTKQRLTRIMYEILDTVLIQMKLRFSDSGRLSFLDLINEKQFPDLCKCPAEVKEKITSLIKQYLVFDEEKL